MRALLGAAVLAGVLLVDAPARADQETTVQWNEQWPRVRVLEMANIAALTAGRS